MFDNLSNRLTTTFKRIRGQARLTDENIQDALRDVRMALLEADVALPVVKSFVSRVRERAIGQEVIRSLTPGQAFIKIVHDELVAVMGEANEVLVLNVQPPAVILVAGLQGAGKTTTVAKLARWLKNECKKSVMVVSCDIYRPAAIHQLEMLARDVGVDFHPSSEAENPIDIARAAINHASIQHKDVLLVDTAGRLHIDTGMMQEISEIHAAIQPVETLFVVDSMTGQDAANTARVFNEALPLTGVVLTKADGDARGGAALSVRSVTGIPIKFIGVGEKTEALEPFHPDRIASRILGMGDVVSLVEEAQRTFDHEKVEKLNRKIKKGQGFDLNDLRDQLEQMNKMGGISALLDKMPGMGQVPEALKSQASDRQTGQMVVIINSMTFQERRFPAIIKGSRKRRIAQGSGAQVQDVNRLLKQHQQMSKAMKKLSKGGMKKMMRAMKGGFPGGLPF